MLFSNYLYTDTVCRLCLWYVWGVILAFSCPNLDARGFHAGQSAERGWQGSAAPACPGSIPATDHHGSWGVLSGGQTAAASGPARQTAVLQPADGERQGGPS